MNGYAREWGHSGREYAHDPTSNEPHQGCASRPIPDIECQSSVWSDAVRHSIGGEDLRAIVGSTVKQWNGIVREYLRKQTGLRLSTEVESNRVAAGRVRKVRSVPVRVVSELPIRFATETRDLTDEDIMVLLHKSKLDDVKSGTKFMAEEYKKLPKIKGSCATEDEIKNVQAFASALLEHTKKHDKSKWILKIDEDILGAYFFRIPEIRLYWIVLGVYSQILDIPIEALTVVTLIHELAHAYTHLGYDIDNRDWDTEGFAESDVYLVEGLAQFYTEVICDQIKQRLPAAKNAFEKLLDGQSDVYKEHRKWFRGEDSEHMGEAIRISMLESRSNGICGVHRFRDILERYRDKFH